MDKYKYLINVIDNITKSAPSKFKSYLKNNLSEEALNKLRSKCYIHLFLLSRFGLLDFDKREEFIVDGTYDGGIDGYFIDDEYKCIYFIQSKFRTKSHNFEEKEIRFEELVSMELDRILKGEQTDINNNKYNGNVQYMIKKINSIPDIARYHYKIILLANIKQVPQAKLKKLTGGFETEIINYQKCYANILFPILSSTYFNESNLFINLNLSNKQSGTKISYSVDTEAGTVEITVVFVPTIEIAKAMAKYRNSILKFNPRCYLDFTENSINLEIIETIVKRKSNEFSLFNNGITILSDETNINERIGSKDRAQLLIKNPQIINGGQTAYSLSIIVEKYPKEHVSFFKNKEVLLKIITLNHAEKDINKRDKLIEEISNATNKQNTVTWADRKSNDIIQLQIQKALYDKYSILYERKRGEFSDSLKNKYITKEQIVTRSELLHISRALQGDVTKKQSGKKYFNNYLYYEKYFDKKLIDKYYFGIICLKEIQKKLNNIKSESDELKRALRLGPYMIIYLLSRYLKEESLYSREAIISEIDKLLSKWIEFERYAINLEKNNKFNKSILDKVTNETKQVFQYNRYYRSGTSILDLKSFFL